jgi:hypothetical protein
MKKDNYLREVFELELNDGFSSGCLKKDNRSFIPKIPMPPG